MAYIVTPNNYHEFSTPPERDHWTVFFNPFFEFPVSAIISRALEMECVILEATNLLLLRDCSPRQPVSGWTWGKQRPTELGVPKLDEDPYRASKDHESYNLNGW
jgi:hypothetical protein